MPTPQKRLISTVSGTLARERPLAPAKFNAGCLAYKIFTAASGAKRLNPHCVCPGTEISVLVYSVPGADVCLNSPPTSACVTGQGAA